LQKAQPRGLVIRIVAVLIGLLLLFVAYYWVHKPINPPLIFSLGGALLDLLTATVLACIAGGCGRFILARWFRAGLSPLSYLEKIALEGTLGLGLISIGALVLGLVGLLKGIVIWSALLVLGILLRGDVRGWIADWRRPLARFARPQTAWAALLTFILAFLLITALLRALAPPYAWDSLTYHLIGPERYLAAGRIGTHTDNHNLGFPQSIEVLYAVTISLFGRDTAAAPIHWLFGLFALVTVAGLVRRYADPDAGLLAAVILMSGYSMWLLFGQPYVDIALMTFGALILALILCWRETGRIEWLALAGFCSGLAMGVKYTAVPLPAVCLFVTIVYSIHTPREAIRNTLITGGAALLAFLPWLLKGTLLYQNPIYPFVFNGVNWDSIKAAGYNTFGRGLIGSGNGWQLLILPLAATVLGVEKGASYSFTTGPWLLTAPLLLIPGWFCLNERQRWLVRMSLVFSIPLAVFWLVMAAFTGMGVQTRLMTPILPLAGVWGGLALHSLALWPRKPLDLNFVVRIMLMVTLLLAGIEVAQTTTHSSVVQYLMAEKDRDTYLFENLGSYYEAVRYLKTLPADSRVRLMWEPRSYHCPVTCIPDILFDRWTYPLAKGETPDAIFEEWRHEGDDYLLIFKPGYEFVLAEAKNDPQKTDTVSKLGSFQETLNRWMTPVWKNNLGHTLYGWK
jgi:4-amino-4-deoxy-L-arabinose transferase-like glycosyltransferase